MKKKINKYEAAGFLLILLSIIVSLLMIYYFRNNLKSDVKPTLTEEQIKEMEEFENELVKDSILWASKHHYQRRDNRRIETFPFDPNQADSITYIRLGLQPWQAHNALKYRKKGGRWKSAEHFRNLYGLDEKDYERLRPYIRISPDGKETERKERQARYDSIKKTYPEKYSEIRVMDLNEADTNDLKKIPGIGTWKARKICKYREQLGGFLTVDQLKEINDLPENITQWFCVVKNPTIRKLNVNTASFSQLVRHPYLNYEQVKEIKNYVQKRGKLRDWNDLRLSKHFTEEDFKRLLPYFEF